MAGTAASDETFPAANVQAELHPGRSKDFQVDPVSSDVAASLANKMIECEKEEEVNRKKKEKERKDASQMLKSSVLVSGAILAVAGAVIVIAKKLKEK